MDLPILLDPSVLRAARQIYRTYYEVHPEVTQRPFGVAIDRFTHRGKLIFRDVLAFFVNHAGVRFAGVS